MSAPAPTHVTEHGRIDDIESSIVPDVARRWLVCLAGAGMAALLALLRWKFAWWMPSDLDHLWHAARAMLAGTNPYDVVGPGKAFDWEWSVFYPLPALLIVAPLTLLPVEAARFVFAVVAGGALGFALGPRWKTH